MDSEFYPKDDHSWKTWMFQEYLQVRGPLTEDNVMEYFEESFLFDRSSNNNVLRMQTMHADPNYRMSRLETENELRRFTGLEYALVHSKPPLFVIQRRDRLSPTEVRPTAVYFILNNVLYSGPDLYTLLSTKLTNALSMIQSSLDTVRAARPDYTPRAGHVWPIVDVPSTSSAAAKLHQSTQNSNGNAGGTAVPDTPAEASKQGPSSSSSSQPHQGSEDNQVWSPFAFALQATRLEMDKRRAAAALANANANATTSGVGLGTNYNTGVSGSGERIDAPGHGGNGAVAGPEDASRRSRAGGGLSLSTSLDGGLGSTGITSSGRQGLNVPTADAPKTKGVPGPPGKPGHGKKKQRRVEKQAMKQSSASTPVPATPI